MSSASTSPRFGYWVTFFVLSVVTLCAVIEAVREKYLPIRPFVDCSSIDMPCPHITPYKNRGADRIGEGPYGEGVYNCTFVVAISRKCMRLHSNFAIGNAPHMMPIFFDRSLMCHRFREGGSPARTSRPRFVSGFDILVGDLSPFPSAPCCRNFFQLLSLLAIVLDDDEDGH